jgi:hypothetical protein
MAGRLEEALAAIDAVNAEDSRRDPATAEPVELAYGRRMSAALAAFAPDASEPLRIAVRAQHIARWRIARDAYPEGVVGYKRWRADLGRMHGDLAADIARAAGYDDPTAARVRDLVMKKGLKRDPEAQILEDVACLVFLEHAFADFAGKHAGDRAKLLGIVRKTWDKMSARGRAAAAALLPALPADLRALVAEAVSG